MSDLSECHEGVTRGGEFQPCDKPAVALRLDEGGGRYPVCPKHTRHPMVRLADALAEERAAVDVETKRAAYYRKGRDDGRAEVIARVAAVHARRPHGPLDFVAHGQTEFPDLCDHCRTTWPCMTAALFADDTDGLSTYFDTLRSMSPSPTLLAAVEKAQGQWQGTVECPDEALPTIRRMGNRERVRADVWDEGYKAAVDAILPCYSYFDNPNPYRSEDE